MDINELRRKRAEAIKAARDIKDAADKENRDLQGDEENNWRQHIDAAAELGKRIAKEEEQRDAERGLEGSQVDPNKPEGEEDDPSRAKKNRGEKRVAWESHEHRATVSKFVRGGLTQLDATELRAMQADDDAGGGYIVPPQEFVTELLKNIDDEVFIRGMATVRTLDKAESLGVPSLDTDIADADWTTELATGSEGELGFGKRELRPHPVAKRVKISNKLLRQAAINAEALVRERLAYKFGITQEKAFLLGSGAGQPLGLFVPSSAGISTARDISTDMTATAITADGLQNIKWGLKPQYRAKAKWLFHTDALKMIAKLKDLDGQYIWQAGLQPAAPDRLLNLPYTESQYVPNTFTTGLYVGMLGDFSNYWIVDALDMTVQRLNELYAETNQAGFIARMETDGMPVIEEAFVRIKLA